MVEMHAVCDGCFQDLANSVQKAGRHADQDAGGTLAARAIGSIFIAIRLPMTILCSFGGVVSGVWLLIRGDWVNVVIGLALGLSLRWIWVLGSLPTMFLVGPFIERGRPPPTVVAFTVGLWNATLVAAWVYFTFAFFAARMRPETTVPIILWSFAVGVVSFVHMAAKEQGDSTANNLGLLVALLVFSTVFVGWCIGAPTMPIIFVIAGIGVAHAAIVASWPTGPR